MFDINLKLSYWDRLSDEGGISTIYEHSFWRNSHVNGSKISCLSFVSNYRFSTFCRWISLGLFISEREKAMTTNAFEVFLVSRMKSFFSRFWNYRYILPLTINVDHNLPTLADYLKEYVRSSDIPIIMYLHGQDGTR